MKDEALTQALFRALLALRITLGLFLLQWGVEKFVVPQNTVAIWSYFYGLDVSHTLGYVFGAAEIAIAGCRCDSTVFALIILLTAGCVRFERKKHPITQIPVQSHA